MFGANLLIGFLIASTIAVSNNEASASNTPSVPAIGAATTSFSLHQNTAFSTDVLRTIPNVPFYSQFRDIHDVAWKKIGCGVTSLAMIIEFYHPGTISVNTLLSEAIASGAYIKGVGWKHADLAHLAERYGLEGRSYDFAQLKEADAYVRFKESLASGPVIASVHYKFDPKSTIPHLVVITGIEGDRVYYNDPAGHNGGEEITVTDFRKAWKKRFITIRQN